VVTNPDQSAGLVARFIYRLRKASQSLLGRGSAAILDQALFAGTNFLLNILLIRWMGNEDQYGAFATGFAVFLLVSAVHQSFLIEPMMIYGAGEYGERFSRYLVHVLKLHILLTAVLSVVAGIFALILMAMASSILAWTALGLSLLIPFLLFMWMMRRTFYVTGDIYWSAMGGGIYFGTIVSLTFLLSKFNALSAFSAFATMGIGAFLTGLFLLYLQKPILNISENDLDLREIVQKHWHYGRWVAPSTALKWIPDQIYYTLLPLVVGLGGSAALRAILNLVMPISNVNAALTMVLIPKFVRTLHDQGQEKMERLMKMGILFFGVISSCYIIVLLLFGRPIVSFIYDGNYVEYLDAPVILLLGIMPFFSGMTSVIGGALRAREWVNLVWWATVVATILTLTLGLILLATGGLLGALGGLLASSVAMAFTSLWLYYHPHAADRLQGLFKRKVSSSE